MWRGQSEVIENRQKSGLALKHREYAITRLLPGCRGIFGANCRAEFHVRHYVFPPPDPFYAAKILGKEDQRYERNIFKIYKCQLFSQLFLLNSPTVNNFG